MTQDQKLIDEREITDRLHDYCRALDLMDLAIHVFTADCVVEFGPDERLASAQKPCANRSNGCGAGEERRIT